MHVITGDNYEEAVDAVRDILMMYVDMASSYEGFGHASDVYVRFDPLKFVDAETDGKAHYVDLDLLRAGSAIAILYFFYDLWCEDQRLSGPHIQRQESALNEGWLCAFPDIENVVREAIARDYMPIEDQWFDEAVVPIYRKYVLGLFERLAASDRSA